LTVGGIPAAGDNDIRHQVVAVGKNQHSKVIKFDLFIPAKLPKCFAVVIRNFKLIFSFCKLDSLNALGKILYNNKIVKLTKKSD
jgi:hypothetical protein